MRLQIQRVFLVACAILQQALCQEPVRIVAVADLHGDYDNSLAVLQMSDLVDDKAKWKGGNNTIFVQTVWGNKYFACVKACTCQSSIVLTVPL